jgi:signal transduction histidine kinase
MTAPNPVRENRILDLSEIVADVVADQSATARDRAVTVELDLASSTDPALVTGNTTTLSRIATNLVANAIKFAPAGGAVRVAVIGEADHVIFSVDDSGPGITEEDAPRIFERFFRSEDPAKRQTPGTGLGLSIVRSLVELLEGSIEVERSALGGARMVVTLPRATADAPTAGATAD